MNKLEFCNKVNSIISNQYPIGFYTFSLSKIDQFWRKYREGNDWELAVHSSIAHIKLLNHFRLFWYDIGVRNEEDFILYTSCRDWNVCKICGKIYNKKDVYSDTKFKAVCTCSFICNVISRKEGGKKLSISKKLYNPKNPQHYANRHSISIDAAKSIISSININSSVRRVEYWILKGYSEIDAIHKVSRLQAVCSPRSITYWLSRGYSQNESTAAVRKIQIEYSNMRKEFDPKSSWLCIEYYLNKNIPEDVGYQLIREKLFDNGIRLKCGAELKTYEERRTDNPRCIEFYLSRGITEDVGLARIAGLYNQSRSKKFVSQISREFIDMVAPKFSEDSLYYSDYRGEFFIFSHELRKVCFYDFTNTTKKFIIEFNGNYWHSEKNKKWTQEFDDKKNLAANDRGFKVFIVWECDFKKDKVLCVDKLVNNIKEWYENC